MFKNISRAFGVSKFLTKFASESCIFYKRCPFA